MSATQTIRRSRAISSACRTAQVTRLVHSSSVNQATALSATSLAGGEPQEIILQPIFDIFDAPSTLAESSQYIRNKYASSSASSSSSSSSSSSTSSRSSSSSRSRGAPAPLPQPIIFDGPARPTNGMLAFQSRMRDAGLRTPPSTQARFAPSSTRTFSSSEPLVQMFDGPARITRYHHQGSRGNESNSTKYMVALGVAGAIGCASIANNTEGYISSPRP
ncbi:hypothetical protein D9619_009873 [Psilocybe cf. subviscida]|uniref:Uncharacterized protein n=1 Tax=Psilocybe cf. subviscida TaxID=2480587 RepID=A0A8H5BLW1_9AGAR|nr:hypothetical protein D9619_009873 [Psilocybe cf. subviscida]